MPVTKASPKPHVAVLAFPFGSHAPPLLSIIRRLAAAAPHAHFSYFCNTNSNPSKINSFSGGGGGVGNVKLYDVTDGVPEKYTFTGRPHEAPELFLTAAPAAFRSGVEAATAETGRRVSCIVTDVFFSFAAEMAEEMEVPWVASCFIGPTSLLAFTYTDAIRKRFGVGVHTLPPGVAGHENKTIEFIPGLSKVRVRDLPEGILFGDIESMFFTMLHRMALMLTHATAVVMNTFEELDPALTSDLKSNLKKLLCIGPLNLHRSAPPTPPISDPNGCIPWLERQNPASVAYISFGTSLIPPPSELKAVAEALEESGVPFLWSLSQMDDAKAHLPAGFPNKATTRGMVVPWAPQTEVLAHGAVGVSVTACGWNSVLESMTAGVPMICRPLFAEQEINGRMIESVWGVGVVVEGGIFTKEGLMRHLDLVLSSELGKKMKTSIKELKEQAEKAVGPEGSSTENFNNLLETVLSQKDTDDH